MLYLLVACAAAQLGGEETDGFSSPDALPDTGGEASAAANKRIGANGRFEAAVARIDRSARRIAGELCRRVHRARGRGVGACGRLVAKRLLHDTHTIMQEPIGGGMT